MITSELSEVTLVITHYNRSTSLERLLHSIKDLKCSFNEIIVSDDGSKLEHLERLKFIQNNYSFRLITSPQNKGLGNNLNKGFETVNTPYVLYIQEDFIPTPIFPEKLISSLDIIKKDETIDLIRFYTSTKYPYLKKYNQNFSELIYSIWKINYKKIYAYGDQPHLRRKTFPIKFGKYKEGLHGDKTEYAMCVAFVQKKGKALLYNEFKKLFTHDNSIIEPSTMIRNSSIKSNSLIIQLIKPIYRFLKYNFDILFMKV